MRMKSKELARAREKERVCVYVCILSIWSMVIMSDRLVGWQVGRLADMDDVACWSFRRGLTWRDGI